MAKPLIVTGFVPIPGHPRAESTYHALGAKLRAVNCRKLIFQAPLRSCWLARHLEVTGDGVCAAPSSNPAKDTLEYHIVQHQKFKWLADAVDGIDRDEGPLVWIDYGIFHVPGVTQDVIEDFLARVGDHQMIEAPGCWRELPDLVSDEHPCWRWCGGLIVVPRSMALKLLQLVQLELCDHLLRTRRLAWEVNTMARVEQLGAIPMRWYEADHNELMFTRY